MIRKNNILLWLVITLPLSFILISTWVNSQISKQDYDYEMGYVDESESYLHKSISLILDLQAHNEGKEMGSEIIRQTSLIPKQELIYYLDNLSLKDNPVRKIIKNVIDGYVFRGIDNDANDPFILRIARVRERKGVPYIDKYEQVEKWEDGDGTFFTYVVDVDTSINCSTVGEIRPIELEIPMHGNQLLARNTLRKIINMDIDNHNSPATHNKLFWQFVDDKDGEHINKNYPGYEDHWDKKAVVLNSYDMDGLYEKFHETKDWRKTYRSFEFITPIYINPEKDLAGRPYVKDGVKQEHYPIILNIVYNYEDVIDSMPEIKGWLDNYKNRRKELLREHEREKLYQTLNIIGLAFCIILSQYVVHLSGKERKSEPS
jgi:hypothetical protein